MVFYAGLPAEEMAALARRAAEEARRLDSERQRRVDACSLRWRAAGSTGQHATDLLERRLAADRATRRHSNATPSCCSPRATCAVAWRRSRPRCGSTRSRLRCARSTRCAPFSPAIKTLALARAAETRALGSPRAGQLESWVHVGRGDLEGALEGASNPPSACAAGRSTSDPSTRRSVIARNCPPPWPRSRPRQKTSRGPRDSFSTSTRFSASSTAALAALHRLEGSTDTAMTLWLPELAPLRRTPGSSQPCRRSGSSTIG